MEMMGYNKLLIENVEKKVRCELLNRLRRYEVCDCVQSRSTNLSYLFAVEDCLVKILSTITCLSIRKLYCHAKVVALQILRPT